MKIHGQKKDWQVVIGLEVHAQMDTKYKLFSPTTPVEFGAPSNTCVSYIDAAFPGTLPVLNPEGVDIAVKTGLAIEATINLNSAFDRKNYFYSDNPQGYQITQMYYPIVEKGKLEIELEDGSSKIVEIDRIHIEQDAGKNTHDQFPDSTLVDLNRAGIGLMEIVTSPCMRAPEEAGAFLRSMRTILRNIDACDGNMDEGSMRCDANVSVMPVDSDSFGTRVEIKNLNSIRNVMKAIEIEAKRQIDLIESGHTVKQETRLFDLDKGVTRSMRDKEDLTDYRYFPEPNLLQLQLTQEYVNHIKSTMPEMPKVKTQRYVETLGVPLDQAKIIAHDKNNSEFFEKMLSGGIKAKNAANWMTTELFSYLKNYNIEINLSPVSPENLGQLVAMIEKGTISGKIAKEVLEKMFSSGKSPGEIVAAEGLGQISDQNEIITVVEEIISSYPDEVQGYLSGKSKLFGFLIGQIMQRSKGKANPSLVNKILTEKLEEKKQII